MFPAHYYSCKAKVKNLHTYLEGLFHIHNKGAASETQYITRIYGMWKRKVTIYRITHGCWATHTFLRMLRVCTLICNPYRTKTKNETKRCLWVVRYSWNHPMVNTWACDGDMYPVNCHSVLVRRATKTSLIGYCSAAHPVSLECQP